MGKKGLKWILLLELNCMVYSLFYSGVEKNSLVDIIWSLSHYFIYIVVGIKISYLVETNTNSWKRTLKLVILYLPLFCSIILSYMYKADQLDKWKECIFILQIITIIICLSLYYLLEKTYSQNKDKSSLESQKVIESEYMIDYISDDSRDIYDRRKVRGALWVGIISANLVIFIYVVPLAIKILRVHREDIFYIYMIILAFIGVSLCIKNHLSFYQNKKRHFITLIEFIGIAIGSFAEYYWNVYMWLPSETTHVIYFGPYVLIGIGLIPFLYVSNQISVRCNEILQKS